MKEYKIWLAKLVTIGIIFFALIVIIAAAGAAVGPGGPQVAVIELTGIIEDAHEVVSALYKHANDDSDKAIVLRIDSPGGAVAPSQEIFEAVKRLKQKKPIVVSMGSVAASGGLYSSLAASKIYCQRGTQTGSIGVILQVPNFNRVADKIGVEMTTIKSGQMKDVGNPFREMSAQEKEFLETTTAKVHDAFIHAVVEGRNIPEEKVRGFADGRVILGSEAKDLGLVDEFGDVYDAAKTALQLAGEKIETDKLPKLRYINRKNTWLERALESFSSLPVIWGGSSGLIPRWKYLSY